MIKKFFGKPTFWKVLLVLVLAAGAYAAFVRFFRGLGASTNLSDAFPWGLWIGFDMLVGVGLAAGGFVIAATVHVFNIKKYEEIARPTILTAFLGYLLVIVALLFDLGRPWNIWHPMIMWNPHSVMFEVGWCVMLYTTVLALEFSPLVFERFGWHLPLRLVRSVYVPLVIVGVLLSTMHQSSLGTLYVIVPDKLHPLWYSPFLPVFFFLSAVAGGLAMTIFESFMSYRAFGKRLEADLLQGLGRVAVVVLGVYALFRLEDLASRGALARVLLPTPESVMFWGEAGLGVLLPMVLFAIPRVRRNEHGLFLAATLTILGFIVNRMNVAITGMAAASGVTYFPSFLEIVVTMSIVAVGFTLFALAVKFLPVFPEAHGASAAEAAVVRAEPAFGGGVLLALWGLLLLGVFAVGFSMKKAGPTPVELVVSLLVVAAAFVAFAAAMRFLPGLKRGEARTSPKPALGAATLATVTILLLVVVATVGYSMARGGVARPTPGAATAGAPLAPAADPHLRLPADYAFPKGSGSPGAVTFSHQSHVDTANPNCATCHAKLFLVTEPGKPARGELTEKRIHEGDLCASCHDGKSAFAVKDDCTACHR